MTFVVNRRLALFLNDGANDYQQIERADCEVSARRQDFNLNVYDAGNNAETQLEQIRSALNQPADRRPCGLLVSPVRESALTGAISDAARLGVGWALLSRWLGAIADIRGRFPSVPVFSVTPDQVEAGRIQGRQVRIVLDTHTEILCIQGPLGTSTTPKRAQGLEEELQSHGWLRRTTFHGDWSEESGLRITRDWLRLFGKAPLPTFMVVAQNDTMAMGAREALLEYMGAGGARAVHGTPLLGCNGTPRYGQHLVDIGILAATVIIPSVAGRAVDLIGRHLAGGGRPDPQIVVPVRPFPEMDVLSSRRGPRPNS